MPALALAEEMVRLDPSVEPFFIGAERGVEAQVLPHRPWRHALLPLEPLRRVEWWKNARLPFVLYRSVRRIGQILTREDPALVVGTGGYVSFPTVRACVARDIPAVIQEQNAYPGLATRFLASHVRQIHLGFPEARSHLKPGSRTEVLVSGNPIKAPPAVHPDKGAAKRRLGFSDDKPLVLALGGSQGALAVNRALRDAHTSGLWPSQAQTMWQTGSGTYGAFLGYAVPGRIHIEPFIDPIESAYAAADLVVSRSGAMTLAEVAAWGLPSILVPLPTSTAGHQVANARAMSAAGSAIVLEQKNATGPNLAEAIAFLLNQPAKMAEMGRKAAARSLPEAASRIATCALRLMPST